CIAPSYHCVVRFFVLALDSELRVLHSFPTRRSSDLGAKNMIELLSQMQTVGNKLGNHPTADALFLEKEMTGLMNSNDFPTQNFRSEEHTSELQSRENLVCRLLLEKKKREYITPRTIR